MRTSPNTLLAFLLAAAMLSGQAASGKAPTSTQASDNPAPTKNERTSSNSPWYSEDYDYITTDGAWCWFSDPRAIYVGDKVYGGYVDKEGSIWAFTYDTLTQEKQTHKVYDKLHADDHSNPSVLALPDKRLVIFFSSHGPSPIHYRVTTRPEDISSWEPLQSIKPSVGGNWGFCYTNPIALSSEKGRIHLFFRGSNFKPCHVTTTDLKTWSEPVTLVDKRPGPTQAGRPYAKYASNGKDKIFIAFTDGHPRNEPTNSIYCVMYSKGKFRKVGGEVITDAGSSIYPDQADLVYDAGKTFDKAWIWDVAVGRDGNPVIAYARFSDQNNVHSYWYARWTGKTWETHKLTDAGQWFMRSDSNNKSFNEPEGNYSGGVYLDHEDPTILYTSRPIANVFEIERWTFDPKAAEALRAEAGATAAGQPKDKKTNEYARRASGPWVVEPVTAESRHDNVRPFVIRNHPVGAPSLLWMQVRDYQHYTNFDTAIKIDRAFPGFDRSLEPEAIDEVASKVFSWQVASLAANPLKSSDARGWLAGVLYRGMFDWASHKDDPGMFKPLRQIFETERWQPGGRMTHADDLCVCQTYLDFYAKFKEEKMLFPTQARFDWILQHPLAENIDNSKGKSERWWWCDALYMAPSVYSRLWRLTGDERYMDYAHTEFLATYRQLFDDEEDLFFRDSGYFNRREANGKEVFWGRGNGWVLAGLMEMLKTLPEDDVKYRQFYLDLYLRMAKRIAALQREDGFWSSSLLDQESYPQPETSSTGMFVAALAYGLNAGILPRDQYLEVVRKGWAALVSAVDADGRLGWVQPVGASPKLIKRSDNALYGTGAFLMAAQQLSKLED